VFPVCDVAVSDPDGRRFRPHWTLNMSHSPDATSAPARPGAAARVTTWTGIHHGSVMGAELVVGILLWSAIGYLVDRWLSTDPWFLFVGAFVGFGGGLYLIWLRSARMERQEQAARDAAREAARSARQHRGGAGEG
jgi:F0F1-type ATP synthase assembly protein I